MTLRWFQCSLRPQKPGVIGFTQRFDTESCNGCSLNVRSSLSPGRDMISPASPRCLEFCSLPDRFCPPTLFPYSNQKPSLSDTEPLMVLLGMWFKSLQSLAAFQWLTAPASCRSDTHLVFWRGFCVSETTPFSHWFILRLLLGTLLFPCSVFSCVGLGAEMGSCPRYSRYVRLFIFHSHVVS